VTGWRPDPLGPGWEQRTLALSAADPDLVATVVRRAPDPGAAPGGSAVLHVHGFNDYFFQTHLADAFAAAGHTFYALDLRR